MSQRTVSNQTGRTMYHQDGLLDIFLALGILFATVAFSAGMFWLVAILPVIFNLLWVSARQSITAPRLVGTSPATIRTGKSQPVFIMLTILGVVAFILGAAVFWLFATENTSTGLREWVRQNFVLVSWVFGGLLLALIAILTRLPRYYFYALLALSAGVGGPLLGCKPVIYVVGLASSILVVGLLTLLHFLRTNPR